jgi:hypothetical protein
MRHLFAPPALLALSALSAHAQPPVNGFCIENRDTRAAVFVVDAGAAYREVATLAPGARLCTPEFPTPTHGMVGVFYDENAMEGCSRLARAGAVHVLLKYNDFDNCKWLPDPGS